MTRQAWPSVLSISSEGAGPRSAGGITVAAPALWLTEPSDQGIEELAQGGRPFGVLRPARRMAEIAVDLEVARIDPSSREVAHDRGGDRRRKKPIGSA